jgi:hypothetical protein
VPLLTVLLEELLTGLFEEALLLDDGLDFAKAASPAFLWSG